MDKSEHKLTKETLELFRELLDEKEEKISGIFIMESKSNNKNFTYKIKAYTVRDTRVIFVAGEIGYNDYHPYYYIINGKLSPKVVIGESRKGGQWFLTNLYNNKIDTI